jgi:hypothetical protein
VQGYNAKYPGVMSLGNISTVALWDTHFANNSVADALGAVTCAAKRGYLEIYESSFGASQGAPGLCFEQLAFPG